MLTLFALLLSVLLAFLAIDTCAEVRRVSGSGCSFKPLRDLRVRSSSQPSSAERVASPRCSKARLAAALSNKA